jgi:hypothetical protein
LTIESEDDIRRDEDGLNGSLDKRVKGWEEKEERARETSSSTKSNEVQSFVMI